MTRRWRQDGPDWATGASCVTKPGGMVAWMHDNTWRAYAGLSARDTIEFKRRFKSLDAAKRAVNRWLSRRTRGGTPR